MIILGITSFGTVLEVGMRCTAGYFENRRQIGLKHNQILLEQIDSVIRDASVQMKDVDLIVCTSGPGSFTAIRIVMATAKGLAAGTGASFITIPTFDVIGKSFSWYRGPVVPVIDGRKNKLYSAVFFRGEKRVMENDSDTGLFEKNMEPFDNPLIVSEQAEEIIRRFLPGKADCISISSGYTLVPGLLELGELKFRSNELSDILASPLYLRKSDAEIERGKMK